MVKMILDKKPSLARDAAILQDLEAKNIFKTDIFEVKTLNEKPSSNDGLQAPLLNLDSLRPTGHIVDNTLFEN
jgi:hypothetical protein